MKDLRHNRSMHSLALVLMSFAVSFLVHLVLLFWLARVNFFITRPDGEQTASHRTSFILEDIKRVFSPALRSSTAGGAGDGADRISDGPEGDFNRKLDPQALQAGDEVDGSVVGASSALAEHRQKESKNDWQQRQEIIAISGDLLGRDIIEGNRRIIPEISRVQGAVDVVFPADYNRIKTKQPGDGGKSEGPGDVSGKDRVPMPFRSGLPDKRSPADRENVDLITRKIDRSEKTERKIDSLDSVLQASLTVYEPFFEYSETYFMLEIERISDKLLPRLPKDILFVQDSSASMSEQRLYFCREGLAKSLELLHPDDRFDVLAFSDRPVRCFGEWVAPGKSSFEKSRRFISNMRSAGNTDILGSLEALRNLDVENGRPCIAFVVTDGIATTGVVQSAKIIQEFTRMNTNQIAVYTMGTMSEANMYLLDLLSYCNGGSTHVVKGGRWSISEDITNRVASISRPVLSGLKVAFAGDDIEVYPSKIRHLFMDDKLVLYGRCPRSMRRLTFQALGSAGEQKCDMIFDIPLNQADRKGTKAVRREWAFQKVYHLIGEMARSGKKAASPEIRKLADEYNFLVPYAEDL